MYKLRNFTLPAGQGRVLGAYGPKNFVLPTSTNSGQYMTPAQAAAIATKGGAKKSCSSCGGRKVLSGARGLRGLRRLGDDTSLYDTFYGSSGPDFSSVPSGGASGSWDESTPFNTPTLVGNPNFPGVEVGTPGNYITGSAAPSSLTTSLIQAIGSIGASATGAALRPGVTLPGQQTQTGLAAAVPGIGISYGLLFGVAGVVLLVLLLKRR